MKTEEEHYEDTCSPPETKHRRATRKVTGHVRSSPDSHMNEHAPGKKDMPQVGRWGPNGVRQSKIALREYSVEI